MADMDERRLHQTVSLVGLRAHATAIGLIQLTHELVRAGVLDEAAVGRIKQAIANDLMLSPPASVKKAEFEEWVHCRLDALFAFKEQLGKAPHPPGTENVPDPDAASAA